MFLLLSGVFFKFINITLLVLATLTIDASADSDESFAYTLAVAGSK